MTRDLYIIDGDHHLRDAPTGAAWVQKMWELDEEGALLWPDEYADLRRELAWYEAQAEADLDAHSRWRFGKLRTFFAAHPEPPPATHPDGTEQTLPDGRVVVWRNGQWELKSRPAPA